MIGTELELAQALVDAETEANQAVAAFMREWMGRRGQRAESPQPPMQQQPPMTGQPPAGGAPRQGMGY